MLKYGDSPIVGIHDELKHFEHDGPYMNMGSPTFE